MHGFYPCPYTVIPRAPQVPEECPASVVQLIEDCMEKPPEGRPTARQAYDIIKECFSSPEALQARPPYHCWVAGPSPLHGLPASSPDPSCHTRVCFRCGKAAALVHNTLCPYQEALFFFGCCPLHCMKTCSCLLKAVEHQTLMLGHAVGAGAQQPVPGGGGAAAPRAAAGLHAAPAQRGERGGELRRRGAALAERGGLLPQGARAQGLPRARA